jgi:chromosome condensin MukBEF complex kleisin-like MukF subunit
MPGPNLNRYVQRTVFRLQERLRRVYWWGGKPVKIRMERRQHVHARAVVAVSSDCDQVGEAPNQADFDAHSLV